MNYSIFQLPNARELCGTKRASNCTSISTLPSFWGVHLVHSVFQCCLILWLANAFIGPLTCASKFTLARLLPFHFLVKNWPKEDRLRCKMRLPLKGPCTYLSAVVSGQVDGCIVLQLRP